MELGFEKTPGKYQLKQPHSGVDADIFWRNYALYSFSIFNIMDKVFFFTSYCNIQKYRGGMNMERDMTTGKPAKILLNFTIPIFIGNVFQQFYSMADKIGRASCRERV